MMFCTECGEKLPDGSKFCSSCGAKLSQDIENSQTSSEVEPTDVQNDTEVESKPEITPPNAETAQPDSNTDTNSDNQESVVESENSESQKTKAQLQLDDKNRWAIFIALCAIVLIVGIAVPLVTVFTNEDSVLNSNAPAPASVQEENAAVTNEEVANTSNDSTSNATNASSVSNTTNNASTEVSEYILPDIGTRLYTTDELDTLTDQELYFARNEIFARYGREFKNQDLVDYFSSKDWYTPQYSPTEFDSMPSPLNQYEHDNLDAIRALEAQRHSPYAV